MHVIPKAAGLASHAKLRPMALQDVERNDSCPCGPFNLGRKQQVGHIRGRQMLQHIWGVKGRR